MSTTPLKLDDKLKRRIDIILSVVAERYQCSPYALIGAPHGISRARAAAVELLHSIVGLSYPQIGWLFRRDHSALLHARKIHLCRKNLPELIESIRTMEQSSNNASPDNHN